MKKFWAICRLREPALAVDLSRHFSNFEDARREAVRLAAAERNSYLVFECLGAADPLPPVPPPAAWVDAEE